MLFAISHSIYPDLQREGTYIIQSFLSLDTFLTSRAVQFLGNHFIFVVVAKGMLFVLFVVS